MVWGFYYFFPDNNKLSILRDPFYVWDFSGVDYAVGILRLEF